MFSATRLTAFVCLALGITVQAAPAGAPGADIAARHDYDNYDHSYDYDHDDHDDNIFTEGLNGHDGLGAIDDALDSFDDDALFKRQFLSGVLGVGADGDASATGSGIDLNGALTNLGLGDILGGSARGDFSATKRELLSGILGNLGVGANGGASATGSGIDLNGAVDNLGLGDILDASANGDASAAAKRELLSGIFSGLGVGANGGAGIGSGIDLNGAVDNLGLGDLLDAGASGDASVTRRELLTSILGGLGFGANGGAGASSSGIDLNGAVDNLGLGDILDAGASGDASVTSRQIVENIIGQGTGLLHDFGLGSLTGSGDASTSTDAGGFGGLLGGLGGSTDASSSFGI